MHPFVSHNTWAKIGSAVPPPLFGGIKEGRGPHLTQYVAWTEVYVRTKRHLNPSSRFATMGGGVVPL